MKVDKKGIDIVCFGGEDWWYHNRGHIDFQLMRQYAQNATVLYVNSLVMQKPKISKGGQISKKIKRKIKSILKGLEKTDAGFWVYSPLALPVHHIKWAAKLNNMFLRLQLMIVQKRLGITCPLVWVACPVASKLAIAMNRKGLIYQRTDRYEDFPNIDAQLIRMCDKTLKQESDLTLYVNADLYACEQDQCRHAFNLDHGVDYALFSTANQNPEKPLDISNVPDPIAGYFGALDSHKLDLVFLCRIADILPDISFVYVGKALADFSELAKRKNVWLLGQKDYPMIPHYGKCFDVSMIPWRQNKWTYAANPIKLKEYLALGKPIVSTPSFSELEHYRDVVLVASSPEEFAGQIKKALSESNAESCVYMRGKVADSSWQSKAKTVLDKILNNETT